MKPAPHQKKSKYRKQKVEKLRPAQDPNQQLAEQQEFKRQCEQLQRLENFSAFLEEEINNREQKLTVLQDQLDSQQDHVDDLNKFVEITMIRHVASQFEQPPSLRRERIRRLKEQVKDIVQGVINQFRNEDQLYDLLYQQSQEPVSQMLFICLWKFKNQYPDIKEEELIELGLEEIKSIMRASIFDF